jgi:hypothetical protein
MPSVYVNWSGRLREASLRDELCLRLGEIAELSHSLFKVPPSIKWFNHSIEGNILLSGSLFETAPSGKKLVKVAEDLFSIRKVFLSGIEFRLYDGRHIYDGEDRVSFVFCVDEDSELDGTLVYVEEKKECGFYVQEAIKQADWYLARPNIHLRYYCEDWYCEDWMDALLSWVKYHFIENLYYWRYEDLAGYDKLSEIISRYGRYEYFEILKNRFSGEVSDWVETATMASQFWAAVQKASRYHEDK